MLSSHSQLVRACRALCTAAALALLPQGAAWAGQDVIVRITPNDSTEIHSFPFPIVAHVNPPDGDPSPTGTVNFKVNGWLVGSSTVNNYAAPFNLQDDHFWSNANPNSQPNIIEADYLGDGCFNPAWWAVGYYNDATYQTRAKSARPRSAPARAAPDRAAGARPGRGAQREAQLTNTTLTPVTSPGQTIDLTAEVTDCQDRTVNPTGTVTFLDKDSKPLGKPAPVLLKVAKITISTDQLAPGDNLLTASFKGTNGFGDSSGTASVTVTPSAKTKAKGVSPPRAYRRERSPGKPRHDLRPQAPPGRGTR